MKNFTLVMALALGGLTMSGQALSPASLIQDLSGRTMQHLEKAHDKNSVTKGRHEAPMHKVTMPMREVAAPGVDDKVIDQIPEGEMSIFQKAGYYWSYNWLFGLTNGMLDGSISRVVVSPEGDKMYIQNPVTYFFDSENNWIVGNINGDEVTFTFPQLISYTSYNYGDGDIEEYWDYALKLEFIEAEDGDGGWYYPTENQDYTFRILADGSLEPTEPEMMIGQCAWIEKEDTDSYWSWQATGDIISLMKKVNEVTVEVPAETEMEIWSLVSGLSTRDVKIGVDGDKMYFAGSFTGLPEAAVVGTIDGDKVTFDNSQYLGIAWSYSALVYFLTGYMEEVEDEEGTYNNFIITENMTFDYDAEKKTLSCPDGAFLLSSLPDRVYYYSYVDAPYLCVPDPNAKVTELLNPQINSFWDYDEEYGWYPEINFNFPTVDADKQPLDKSRLYYEVIVDGEPYEFYDDEYELPEGETMITEVPFGFNSYNFFASGIQHDVIIYSIGFETLGIRTLYKGNDHTLYSDIVWVDQYTKVNDTLVGKEVAGVRYYDLLGNNVNRPANGIFIRQTTYTDGSVKAEKVIRR